MSISFVADNSPAGEDEVYVCLCRDFDLDEPCDECGGTGEIRFPTLQYEAGGYCAGNVAKYIKEMTCDGEFDYCGYVEPDQVTTVLERLKQLQIAQQIKPGFSDHRLKSIIRVFTWAAETGNGVTWS